MYIVYMAGRPPRQKAKNDARQQLCCYKLVLARHMDETGYSVEMRRVGMSYINRTRIFVISRCRYMQYNIV